MQFLRSTLFILALASPLAACFSYEHEGDHAYHGRYYDRPGDSYDNDGGGYYYYYHRD